MYDEFDANIRICEDQRVQFRSRHCFWPAYIIWFGTFWKTTNIFDV
jgi:hypothetical protein